MFKQTLLIVVILLATVFSKAQIVDVAPNGDENYRSVEGGAQKVIIDKITPVNILIDRLKKPWDFVETGKGYWIGYTDDMYSIAAHSVYAIRPLIKLAETTNDLHTKLGAVYTLHLIGINRKIIGRFSEKFTDKNARNALLYLLKYPDIGETIMTLLVRDPWQSDVPQLFKTIKTQGTECWWVIGALKSYELPDSPLDGQLPDKFDKIVFTIPYKASFSDDDFDIQYHQCLDAIKRLRDSDIHIENDLLKIHNLWGDSKYGMNEADRKNDKLYITVSEFVEMVTDDSYGNVGSKLNYYLESDGLHLSSPKTTRYLILNWWNNQPYSYKQQFTADSKKM